MTFFWRLVGSARRRQGARCRIRGLSAVPGNLYVQGLPDFWRLLYTISRDWGERTVIVVEIVNHAQYDKWFPYRGR